MFDKHKLIEMFNFTTNKNKTIQRALFDLFQITPIIVYQFVLSKNIDDYIPNNNVKLVITICLFYILYIYNIFVNALLYLKKFKKYKTFLIF